MSLMQGWIIVAYVTAVVWLASLCVTTGLEVSTLANIRLSEGEKATVPCVVDTNIVHLMWKRVFTETNVKIIATLGFGNDTCLIDDCVMKKDGSLVIVMAKNKVGTYQCEVIDGHLNMEMNETTLHISDPFSNKTLSSNRKNIYVNRNSSFAMPCPAADGSIALLWRRGGDFLKSTVVAYVFQDKCESRNKGLEITRNGTLVIKRVSDENCGNYCCEAYTQNGIHHISNSGVQTEEMSGPYLVASTHYDSTRDQVTQRLICSIKYPVPDINISWYDEVGNLIQSDDIVNRTTGNQLNSTLVLNSTDTETIRCCIDGSNFVGNSERCVGYEYLSASTVSEISTGTSTVATVLIVSIVLNITTFVIGLIIVKNYHCNRRNKDTQMSARSLINRAQRTLHERCKRHKCLYTETATNI